MQTGIHRGWCNGLALALTGAVLIVFCGCKTIREELQPVRETTLTVARSGGDVTLSWIGVQGMYYTVMVADARGARAQWKPLPDAVNVRALVTGEPILVKDRVPASQPRYYRLVQNAMPLVP
ncbi:MAG: hypothetical protein GX548_00830 [Lentisphaerae bacterium]|nr:hypothetical protein [Lentisphaerota bacterium]